MNEQGAGNDIAEVLRRLGKEALVAEAEAAGLSPRGGRMRCPFEGCRDKAAAERTPTMQTYPGKRGEWRVHCHRCGKGGSLIDLLAATRGMTDKDAIAHLRGRPMPQQGPALRVVRPMPQGAAGAPDKLEPQVVDSIWRDLATESESGQAYLESRGLGEAARLGLVRFAHPAHPERKVQEWAKRGRLVVCPLKDVVGQPRGLQARLVREPVGKQEPKIASLKGSVTSRAFFGWPELIESSPVVAVAEGLADTLALAGWTHGYGGVAVVGAAGKDALPRLAEELERCDISVEGRVFALFPQNDRPLNKSRASFERLGQLLHRRGARVVMISTPEDSKDLADWLRATPDAEWPPGPLAAVLGGADAEGETPAERLLEPVRGGLPIPERVTVQAWGQNLSTLMALLDDPLHREAITGRRGELAYNEMTGEVSFAGRPLDDADITGMRVRIELHAKTPEGKTLKFTPEDIWSAVSYLSRRRTMHPIRDWLRALKWDGIPRIDDGLPRALGVAAPSLEAHLLRKWLLSAVARALTPGCQVHTVLTLVGAQGGGKSTFFREMAGGEWFCDSLVSIGDVDGYGVLRRAWIVEWAELDSLRRARDKQAVRAFLTSAVDSYRPKWGRTYERVPRGCVIVGTTNDERFLQDEERRFWPVRVAANLDLTWVRANRDQLWAEALALVDGGEQWHLEAEYETVLRGHNESHQTEDIWQEHVRDWLAGQAGLEAVQVGEIMDGAVGKPSGQWHAGDGRRIADILRALGWIGPRRRWKGRVGSWWVSPLAGVAP